MAISVPTTKGWHAFHNTIGAGHAYQGRFKSFPVQEDEHFLTVCRYVERNALRAGLVRRAEDWRWSSLWRRERGPAESHGLLGDWPVPRPEGWVRWVNQAQTEAELLALRRCVVRGCPYGEQAWVKQTAVKLRLEVTLRPRGRPKKTTPKQAGNGS